MNEVGEVCSVQLDLMSILSFSNPLDLASRNEKQFGVGKYSKQLATT